eukprot:6566893-Alexandrium_andersonii.AAC.1
MVLNRVINPIYRQRTEVHMPHGGSRASRIIDQPPGHRNDLTRLSANLFAPCPHILLSSRVRAAPRARTIRISEDGPTVRVGEVRQPPSAAVGVQQALGDSLQTVERVALAVLNHHDLAVRSLGH